MPRMGRQPDHVRVSERIEEGTDADVRVLEHLANLGCDPSLARESTHYVYLPTRPHADAVASVLDRDGWATSVTEGEDETWLVEATRSRVLTPGIVRRTRTMLEALASEHGGFYDGWEAKL